MFEGAIRHHYNIKRGNDICIGDIQCATHTCKRLANDAEMHARNCIGKNVVKLIFNQFISVNASNFERDQNGQAHAIFVFYSKFVLYAICVPNFEVQWKKSPMSGSVKIYASQPLLRNERQFDKLKSHANTIDCKLFGRIKISTEKWLIIVLEIGVWLKVIRACSLNWSKTLVN